MTRFQVKRLSPLLSIVVSALWICEAKSREPISVDTAHVRSPVALAVTAEGRWAYTANRDTGSISVVDLSVGKAIREIAVGQRLADLCLLPGDQYLLAADDVSHELVVLARLSDASVRPVRRISISHSPVKIGANSSGSLAAISSLWSRRVTLMDCSTVEQPRIIAVVDLPFAPRELVCSRDDAWLFVADAFGGRLAVVNVTDGAIETVHRLRASNIRGLTVDPSGERLLVAHQIVHRDRTTTGEDVHWGGVLSNVVRTLSIDDLIAGRTPADDLFYLGNPDHAAGDPTGLLVTNDNRQIVAFAGVSEVGISDPGANHFEPTAVGRRPTAIALSPDHATLYVANTFADSISVVDVATRTVRSEVSLGPTPPPDVVRQGEQLFYDATLASDGWYSCHSCHTDGHSNGALNDNFGDESYGAPKRVLTLGGVAETAPWAWNGTSTSLETQIRKSIEVTMQGKPPTEQQVDALAAYLRTLKPPPAVSVARVYDRSVGEDSARERGARLFEQLNCSTCHTPPNYTSADVYDVGLEDELGHRHFNPPSLRGVSQRDRLFHDGRATDLRDVLTRFRHQLDQSLDEQPLNDLIRFVEGL